jgi:hypothetical protein
MSTNCSGGNDTNIKRCGHKSDILGCSVADSHHVGADPDPACRFDVDLDPDPSFQKCQQTVQEEIIQILNGVII